ncbi:helix-turn-helix domain-containing protein [Sediminibacterium soli]|uniref:helix-turn-helix domain-containing protein n=1 Tax=Sediminibacterium soli TaxID=2698829 RepID=UPI0013797757|nr:helix-turn-helix transcriptional regulator [Sediminibacterium soli]NCI45795.1 helix-turn-helix transcriptional regulator [Sediminibacterium soli]
MDLASTLTLLRKKTGISREDLAASVGTSGAIIGRYERGEITPSVEVAARIAEALEVSLDYLVGNTSVMIKDKKMLYRLELLEKITEEDRNTILRVVDSFLKEAQHNSTSKKLKA